MLKFLRWIKFIFPFLLISCAHSNKYIPYRNISSLVEHKPNQSPKTKYLESVESFEDFKSISIGSKGVIRNGYTIKFVIDKSKGVNSAQVYFLNPNHRPSSCDRKEAKSSGTSHFHFSKCLIKNFAYSGSKSSFDNNFYYTSTLEQRNYVGGRIQSTEIEVDGQKKIVLGVRFIERDLINRDMIEFVMKELKKVVTGKEAIIDGVKMPMELAFVVNSSNHVLESSQKTWFKTNNVGLYSMADLMKNVPFIALNPGEAYGVVNYFPDSPDDVEAYDIAVFDQIPLDLAVVAGTITHSFQDVGSHVNLKSIERKTPNMVARRSEDLAMLKRLNGKPVRLKVAYDGFTVEELGCAVKGEEKVCDTAKGIQIVKDKFNEGLPERWGKPDYKEFSEVISFHDICPHDKSGVNMTENSSASRRVNRHLSRCLDRANEFGGKAAGMAFLNHNYVAGVGSPLQSKEYFNYRLSPLGFGVPLTHYEDFIEHNRSLNPEFAKKLDELIESEQSKEASFLPTSEKKKLIDEIRSLFLNAEIKPENFTKLQKAVSELKEQVALNYPGTKLKKIKIRSSANTEDIEGFNGAGLHDSFSAQIKKKPEHVLNQNTQNCNIIIKRDEETGLDEEKVEPKSLACAVKAVYASLWSLRAVRERSYKRRFDHKLATMGLSIQPVYEFRKDNEIAANSVLITRVVGTSSVYGQQMSVQKGNGLVTNPTPDTQAELLNVTFQANETNFGINVIQYAKPKQNEPALTQTVMPKDKILQQSEIAREVEKAYCRAKNKTYFYNSKGPRDCKYVGNSTSKPKALDMEFKYFENGEILIKQVRTFTGK